MAGPAWWVLLTSWKFSIWAANRAATWTTSWWLWKRHHPGWRRWAWLITLNVVSGAVLFSAWYWLRLRKIR